MGTIGETTLEEAASQAAGNWKRYSCFCWDRMREIDDPDDWAIIYTHHRDSGLLDQSNAAAMADALRSFSESENPMSCSRATRTGPSGTSMGSVCGSTVTTR